MSDLQVIGERQASVQEFWRRFDNTAFNSIRGVLSNALIRQACASAKYVFRQRQLTPVLTVLHMCKRSIDRAFNAGWEAGKKYYDGAGVLTGVFGYYIIALFIWVATLLLCLYAAFLFLLAKIAIAVLLAVGPIFIVLVLFDQTKRFFESWVAQLANYMLLQVIAAGILGLTITFFTATAADSTGGELGMDQAIFMVVIALLTTLVLQQAPSIASGLAGGATLGGQGAFGFVFGGAAGRAGRLAGGAYNRTAPGRERLIRQATRQTSIQLEARKRVLDARGPATAARTRAATPAPTPPPASGTTSGLQASPRIRQRLADRP